MGSRIGFLMMLFVLSGCGVELRDKAQPQGDAALGDWNVDREMALPASATDGDKKVYRLNRWVLNSDSRFYTQGGNVRIEVKELIADHAQIRSFREGAQAPANQTGRSGGHLEIVADHAVGDLDIELNGEKGGDTTTPGPQPNESLKGSPGSDGTPGAWVSVPGNPYARKCIQAPSDGGPAGTGKQGFQGYPGQKGGDGGSLQVRVTQESPNFHLTADSVPGDGGAGGPGGSGGAPGDRGKPAQSGIPIVAICSVIPQLGPSGGEGDPGKPGYPGKSGTAQSVCWQISDESIRCK